MTCYDSIFFQEDPFVQYVKFSEQNGQPPNGDRQLEVYRIITETKITKPKK